MHELRAVIEYKSERLELMPHPRRWEKVVEEVDGIVKTQENLGNKRRMVNTGVKGGTLRSSDLWPLAGSVPKFVRKSCGRSGTWTLPGKKKWGWGVPSPCG